VHRDVKPANILLARHGDAATHAYLCDFGLAKHASTVSSLTGDRAIVGTVDYLAPEQIEGAPVDGRADEYALGCVLFECLTGRPPYARDNELAALLAHVREPPPRVTDVDPELPAGLDDVLAVALAHDRDARYPTCQALIAAARVAVAGGTPEAPPAAAPATTVRTFLFADIRGYTAYTREHGDEAAAALAGSFAALARELAPEHDGTLQELRGDEALLVFGSAREALRYAVDLQRRLGAAALPRGVGIGLDAGEAVPVEDGFRGGALNRAARLCAIARAGEVLASEAVVELAGEIGGVTYGLRRLERLKGFDRPVRAVEVHPDGGARRGERRRRARRALSGTRPRRRAAGLAAIAAVAALAIVALTGGDDPGVRLGSGQLAVLSARTLQPIATLGRVGAPDVTMAAGKRAIWAFDLGGGVATRIDARSRRITSRVPLGDLELGAAADGAGSLWIGSGSAAEVQRFDPAYGSRSARIHLPVKDLGTPDQTSGLAFGAGSLWVGYGHWPFRLARIDPATNRVTRTLDLPGADSQPLLAFGGGALWVVAQDTGRFWKIDPRTNAPVGGGKLHGGWVSDAAFVGGHLWLPVLDDNAVWEIDADGDILRSVPTGAQPQTLGTDGRALFVANQNGGTVSRIDPATARVRTVRTGHRPTSSAVAGGLVWVSLSPSTADARQGLDPRTTVRIVSQGDPWYVTDPAFVGTGDGWQLVRATGARLLRIPDGPQPRDGALLPEIGDQPVLSDGGRTYTFRVRPRYRFSPPSNALVTAQTMRLTIERALWPGHAASVTVPPVLDDVVGVKAYQERRAAHISGIRVRGDQLSVTLVRPAPDFPARVSLPYFSAVPDGTPVRPHGLEKPIPSAGPYYLASHIGDSEAVLRRNPNYRGPRPRQVAAFVWTDNVAQDRSVGLVTSGRADIATAPPSVTNGGTAAAWQPDGALERRYGRTPPGRGPRFVSAPQQGVRFLSFNSTRGIFRDARLRRAVALALDRRPIAQAGGERPWSSFLPPGMPGASDARAPIPEPDLARAKALARGRGGRAVMFVNTPDRCRSCAGIGAVVRSQLEPLGIRLTVRADERAPEGFNTPGLPADLVQMGWIADWPDPSNFLNGLLDPRPLGYGYPFHIAQFDDPGLIAEMRKAYRASGPARAAAYRAVLARLGRSVPVVPVALDEYPTLLGKRVGCASFAPQDGGRVNLAALCLHG
jgi:ABC-type transport system substrate-binding protein/class 3 adenylate cyclase